MDEGRDHVRGPSAAPIELVEYGDFECPHCRAAHEGIEQTRERLGDRLRYVFRHLPNPRLHPNAELAAEAAEAAGAQGRFWEMHDALFAAHTLGRDELLRMAGSLELDVERFSADLDERRFSARVREDVDSAMASGAHGTPTFFLNGRRYEGAWDPESLGEAMDQPLSYRVRRISQDFAGLPAAGGLMLLLGAGLALLWANSPIAHGYEQLWETEFALRLASSTFALSLGEWVNQGLMALFFFVVGLEVKRELTVGELASPRRAALPIAAAVGGMLAPAAIYSFANQGGPGAHGWGVPISTDTAFALGLLALFGRKIPLSLKIFVAALAIADDVLAILVITLFYASDVSLPALALAALLLFGALCMNRSRVYHPLPYALLGIALWLAVAHSGIHATIAGVALAMVIPTRSPPATPSLLSQSVAAFKGLEAPLPGRDVDEGHFQAAVRTLETVVDRLLSPAQRLERDLQPWSAFFVLPLLALANAGIPVSVGSGALSTPVGLGIFSGLVLGKPLGIVAASLVVVRTGATSLPEGVTWRSLTGAACLCGIGFTMSIFIADAAFQDPATLSAAKLSTIGASLVSGVAGWLLLVPMRARRVRSRRSPPPAR